MLQLEHYPWIMDPALWETRIKQFDEYPLMDSPIFTMVYCGTASFIAPIIIPRTFKYLGIDHFSVKLQRAILYLAVVLLCITIYITFALSNAHNSNFWCTIKSSFFTDGQEDLYLLAGYLYLLTHMINCFDIVLLSLEGLPVSKTTTKMQQPSILNWVFQLPHTWEIRK
jgi:hypothetical protein